MNTNDLGTSLVCIVIDVDFIVFCRKNIPDLRLVHTWPNPVPRHVEVADRQVTVEIYTIYKTE